MISAATDGAAHRWLAVLLQAAAWSCYLPLGIKYAVALASTCLALHLWRRSHGEVRLTRAPGLHAALALLAVLTLSATWSPASWPVIASHLGQYGLLLLVPLIGAACSPESARRGLAHFVMASTVVGLLFLASAADLLPASRMWHTTVDAEGNQRIANSILLAMASAIALHLGLQSQSLKRLPWLVAAALCTSGLILQDRRSGMLLLPLLLFVWAVVGQPGGWRRTGLVVAVAASAGAAWHFSDGVRGRFAEGIAEIRHYESDDRVSSSWGQRLRMWELTAEMVQERPLTGHGVASWRTLWRERVTPGTPLAANSTPHNEYLLLAQQAGAVGCLVWLWLLAGYLRHAVACGAAGLPLLVAWVAIAWTGLFNAVLRDAKFSLPLLLLAAMAFAAAQARPGEGSAGGRQRIGRDQFAR